MTATDDYKGPVRPLETAKIPSAGNAAHTPPRHEPEAGLVLELAQPCGTFTVLDLCELAHRDVTQQPLCLGDQDVRPREADMRRHLEGCGPCSRWYRNARRAYERLAGDVPAAATPPAAQAESQRRKPRTIRAAAGAPGCVLQKLPPLNGAALLDGLAVQLVWNREPRKAGAPGKGRWWVTVKLLSRQNDAAEGNAEATLEQLDGFGVRIAFHLRGRQEVEEVVTRLGFDAQQNLASIPRSLTFAQPRETETVTLALLDRAETIADD
ncbi:MAG TPA: hypothetical protein VEL76_02420 [Gemmataceae bacterium]|nr:hypothetical protein [Gemmataceae bacterium]